MQAKGSKSSMGKAWLIDLVSTNMYLLNVVLVVMENSRTKYRIICEPIHRIAIPNYPNSVKINGLLIPPLFPMPFPPKNQMHKIVTYSWFILYTNLGIRILMLVNRRYTH